MKYKLKNGGTVKLQTAGRTIPKREQKRNDKITKELIDEFNQQQSGISTNGEFVHRVEESLKDEHPGAALLFRKIPVGRILQVLANPASASTTTGAMAATAVDASGLVGSAYGLADKANKIKSGDFTGEDVPETALYATGFIPGASAITKTKNLNTATNIATKIAKNVDNAATIGVARATGKLHFEDPKVYSGGHQTMEPITEFKYPYNRGDVINHNADPNGAGFTIGSPVKEGFLSKRRFSQLFEIPSQKQLVQEGEIKNLLGGKNNIRNAIVKYGRKRGADAIEFRGIADNNLAEQNVLFITDKVSPELKRTINHRVVLRERIAPDLYTLYLRDNRHPNIDIGQMELGPNSEGYYISRYINNLNPSYKHVSEDLYDAAIKTAKENGRQFLSGSVLESPEATTRIGKTYDKFGLLEKLDDKGVGTNVKANTPRVILKDPVGNTSVVDIN